MLMIDSCNVSTCAILGYVLKRSD